MALSRCAVVELATCEAVTVCRCKGDWRWANNWPKSEGSQFSGTKPHLSNFWSMKLNPAKSEQKNSYRWPQVPQMEVVCFTNCHKMAKALRFFTIFGVAEACGRCNMLPNPPKSILRQFACVPVACSRAGSRVSTRNLAVQPCWVHQLSDPNPSLSLPFACIAAPVMSRTLPCHASAHT